MSKKCCGFIYSDEDQICRICGNPLTDDEFVSGGTGRMSDMDILLSSLSDKTDEYDEYSYQDNSDGVYEEAQDIHGYEEQQDMYENIPDDYDETESEYEAVQSDEAFEQTEDDQNDYAVDLFANDTEEKNKMDILDEIEAEEQAAEEAKIKPGEEKAPNSIKVVGVLSIVLAVMALAMSGVFIYFMVISPSYDKEGESLKMLSFPEIATSSDVELTAPRDYISTAPLATSTDYTVYEPVEPEIEEPDSTVTDATTTDADVAPEAEVVE